MTTDKTQARPPEYGGATGSALLDAVKKPIAKAIARHTPLSAGQVLYVIEYASSIDLAIAAIDFGCVQNIDPTAAVRAIRAQNVDVSISEKGAR